MKQSSSSALLSCDFIKQIYSYLQLEYHYALPSKSFTIRLNRTISGSKTENSIIYNSVQKKKSLYYYYFLFLVLKVITQSSHNVPLPFNQTLIGLFSKIFRKVFNDLSYQRIHFSKNALKLNNQLDTKQENWRVGFRITV